MSTNEINLRYRELEMKEKELEINFKISVLNFLQNNSSDLFFSETDKLSPEQSIFEFILAKFNPDLILKD